jgi:hypothetical protein
MSAGSNPGQANRLGSFLRGAFATRGACGDVAGSGAPAQRGGARPQTIALLCLVVAAAMALTATSAFAVKTHPYTGTSFGPDGAAGSATFNNLQGVAFDQVAGDVYAYDAGAGKVYKFDSAGAPVNFSGLTGNVIEGVGGGGGNGEFEIAVAPAGSPGGTAGDIYVANNSVVKIYAPSGAELGQLTGGETCGVATSPSGHVFVGIYPNEIREYVPSANPATNADQSAASTAELAEICNVAADGLGNVFAANFYGGSSVVKLEGLSDPIAAPVDPGAPTLAIDPSNNDLYANRGGVVAQHDSAGNLLSVFGSEQLSGSRGIAVNGAAQKTYAASSRGGKVAVFGPAMVVPGASTEPATGIAGTKGTLNGTVNPDNLPVSDCKFEYGTTTAYGSTKPCEGAIPTDGNDHPVSAALTGLKANTTYHFRIAAANANGSNRGADQSFTTNQPSVTKDATEVKGTKAILNGTVLPEGEAVSECFFEYGAGFGYGKTAPCVGAIPTDEGEHPVTAALTHLTPNATTHFRLVIHRGSDVIPGADKSFKTQATVITGVASAIAPPSATIEGTVNPEGIPYTGCSFEYGLTTAFAVQQGTADDSPYEATAPCTESPASIGEGSSPVTVHANLSGLSFGAVYHYRLVATNVDGTSRGAEQNFKTPGAVIEVARAISVGTDEATLEARINPKGSPTTYRIEYGTDTSYGTSTPETPIGAEETGQVVSDSLNGLAPATVYHWRVVATNSVGVSQGVDRTFTTFAPPAPPETSCPNQAFRNGPGADLPDCRAYEQASPLDKHGANIQRGRGYVQASAAGGRITFGVAAGLPTTGGSSNSTVFAASRGVGAWNTNGLGPLLEPGRGFSTLGWDDEIAATAFYAQSAAGGGVMLGDTATGTYQLAVPRDSPFLADFADDTSHFTFESGSVLAPGAIAGSGGEANLYDVDHGTVSLVGRIPAGAATSCDDVAGPACIPAPQGSFAGPYNWQDSNTTQYGGSSGNYYVQNTTSNDGSKVFFTAAGSGQLYVREGGTATTQISASQAATPDPNGHKPAAFVAATPDGSKVFFLSCEKLTDDSTAVSNGTDTCVTADQGQDLYVYDTASGDLSDLTVDPNVGDPQHAGVVGFLGVSGDGSDAYFVANGLLAPGASPGNCGIVGFSNREGTCNLYLSHAGTITFVASVDASLNGQNWTPLYFAGNETVKRSRVAADGTLLFTSTPSLTGYDNTTNGSECVTAAGRCSELFRYAPAEDELDCVSCNPTGAAPRGSAVLAANGSNATVIQHPFLSRNISADGNRVFFDSPDPLVVADTNGVNDPYEWEAEGTGTCRSSAANGGCLYLLSPPGAPEPSYLGDVSASGEDAFFFTDKSLVAADKDQLTDVYDARVGGGLASQNQGPPQPPCLAEACRGASTGAANESSPGSASFNGPGNQAQKPVKRCKKQSQKKCKKSKKQKKSKSKQSRGAHDNRGGSK